jgi:hypothetical protein
MAMAGQKDQREHDVKGLLSHRRSDGRILSHKSRRKTTGTAMANSPSGHNRPPKQTSELLVRYETIDDSLEEKPANVALKTNVVKINKDYVFLALPCPWESKFLLSVTSPYASYGI